MVKRILLLIACLALIPAVSSASTTLYEYYGGNLPSISQRAKIAHDAGILNYTGEYKQNVSLLGYLQASTNPQLGAQIPTIVALFETSLASKITSSATTMTLVSGTDKNGTTLSGTYGFIIDEGTSSEEFVLATCSNTACTAMRRGLSVIDGWTEVSALKLEHRRGASVKITNYPQLAILSRILDGSTTTPALLLADASLSNSSIVTNQYATVGYVNGVGAGGFTASNVSSYGGLRAMGTVPETVGLATTTTWNFGTQSFDRITPVGDNTSFIDLSSYPYISVTTGSKQHIYMDNVDTKFNYAGNDIDLQVYGNKQQPLIVVDSNDQYVGIATSTFTAYPTTKFIIATSTTIAANATTTGSFTIGGTLATGDDGFIKTLTGTNEATIAIPSGTRRIIITISSDGCNVDTSQEMTLTYPGRTTASIVNGYYQTSEQATTVTATTTSWTTLGYNASGSNCGDGTDAQAWFYRY